MAALCPRLKSYAENIDEYLITKKNVLVRGSVGEHQRAVTIVPLSLVERVIWHYHEGPGGSHQGAKATAAKIARVFIWPAMKREIKIYIASCTLCVKYLKHGLVPRAGIKPMEVSSREDYGHGYCRKSEFVAYIASW